MAVELPPEPAVTGQEFYLINQELMKAVWEFCGGQLTPTTTVGVQTSFRLEIR